MPLHTSHSQGGETVDQRDHFRGRDTVSPVMRDGHAAMILLIDRLEIEFPAIDICLLTSHDRLVLMDSPTYDGGDWLVIVHSILGEEHHISYRMPHSVSRFPRGAEVHATARGLEEAVAFVRIAMRESGNWSTSTELSR